MPRYIDGDLLLEEVENNIPLNWTDSEAENQEQLDYRCFISLIERQPTADVAPKGEVAREIFEEIDKLVITKVFPSGSLAILIDAGEYKKLKKKYAEVT